MRGPYPLIVVLALIALSATVSVPALYFSTVEQVSYREYGITVKYSTLPLTQPGTVTLFVKSLRQDDRVSVVAYAWLPNGSNIMVGSVRAIGPVIYLVSNGIKEAYSVWGRHLESMGVEPGAVSIGLTILGTVLRNDGLYGFVSVVPINVAKATEGYGIEVDLDKPLIKLMGGKFTKTGKGGYAQGTPPSPIRGSCYPDCDYDPSGNPRCRVTCYEWRYEGNYSRTMSGVDIPVVSAVLLGYSAYSKVSFVHLMELLVAKESANIRIGISAVASVTSGGGSGEVTYEVAGKSWEVSSQTAANLTFQKGFARGRDYSINSIVYVGFKGDISIATYRLYKCVQGALVCIPSDIWANITVARPLNGGPLNNDIAVWGTASLYYYDNPVTRTYIDFLENGWIDPSSSRQSYDDVSLTAYDVERELDTLISLSGGFNVLSLLMDDVPSSFSALLSASVGVTAGYASEELMVLSVYAYVDSDAPVYWTYARSPITYEVGDEYYRVGCVFVRITG